MSLNIISRSISSTTTSLLFSFLLILIIGDHYEHSNKNGPSSSSSGSSMTASAIPFNAIVPNLSTGWFHKPGPAESIFFGLIVLKVLALRMAGVFPYNLNELLQDGSYFDKLFVNNGYWDRNGLEEDGVALGAEKADKKLKRAERDLYFTTRRMNPVIGKKLFSSAPAVSGFPFSFSNQKFDLNSLFKQNTKYFGLNSSSKNIKKYHSKNMMKNGAKESFGSKLQLSNEIETVERILLGLRRIDSHDCFIRHVCQMNQNVLSGSSSPFDEAILKIFSLKPSKTSVTNTKLDKSSIWDIYREALNPSIMDCNQKYQLCPLDSDDMKPTSLLNGLL